MTTEISIALAFLLTQVAEILIVPSAESIYGSLVAWFSVLFYCLGGQSWGGGGQYGEEQVIYIVSFFKFFFLDFLNFLFY